MKEINPSTPPADLAGAYTAFLAAYPTFQTTAALDELRRTEYGRLDAQDHVYLDYTGGGLYADSQLDQHAALLRHNVFGNPHSHNPTSLAMTELVERARAYVLDYFNATAEEYVVIFTANASSALKLVGESYPFAPGGQFLLAADDHNSVNGIREYARARGAAVQYAPLTTPELRLDQSALARLLAQADPRRHNLFAFPAQSNYSGVKHPLELIAQARAQGWDVLLDCAAFAPTNRLDLERWQPDFASFSFYKIFGYPTGVGALLARRAALAKLQRPWFAGGTVKIVSTKAQRHFLAEGEAAFEDGTVNYLMLPAVEIGLRHIERIGIGTIAERVRCLTGWLLDRLTELRHSNGRAVAQIHGPASLEMRGGTLTLSFFDPHGAPISGQIVEQLAAAARISLRTGCFCNPGAGETSFHLPTALMTHLFDHADGMQFNDLVQLVYEERGVDVSAVRVSVGLVTNFADVYRFIQFAAGFRDRPAADFSVQETVHRAKSRDAA
jgi:molybdenum cofactor sulfurtransferase